MAKLTQEELNRYVINELLSAAKEISEPIREMAADEVSQLRRKLAGQFGPGQNYQLTFDNMAQKSSIQNSEGWRLLSSFLKKSPHFLFYDHSHDGLGLEIFDGSQISEILERCFGFPFYITDKENTFVIGMNDHDYLVGTGSAAAWVSAALLKN